ncbi:MAG: carbamoyltransferase HypF [Desulfobacterium sp.]|jgi:hydrogenase maturation protein HypF|nr:carbamoyltransferase HypF [Desulfobacterium sp.]
MKRQQAAVRVEISGVVQGVGFRPFLFQLAKAYGFRGEVLNTPQGVTLTLEGDLDSIAPCCKEIEENHPPLALVSSIQVQPAEVRGYDDFRIITSSSTNQPRSALISPDITVCGACLDEMNDPADRRFGYPFINCTNCGPRYTIIKDLPYDRVKTSMADFTMCQECQAEYDDPLNRRFHAQPNACAVCGPHVWLTDSKGAVLSDRDAILDAGERLSEGAIVAVKGLGGFHLGVNAFDDSAVQTLRDRKNRPHKPFALMARDLETLKKYVRITPPEQELLTSVHRPIVLLEKHEWSDYGRGLDGGGGIKGTPPLAPGVAPDNRRLGIMLPYTPLHHLLFKTGPGMLVMTSGNRSGQPLSIDNGDALCAFAHIADFFLLHNRNIYFRADDSIVQHQGGTRFLRRSRGYAPLPVILEHSLPPLLACGGGLKSTVCLVKENRAFLSQHIGDLDDEKSFEFYHKSVDHLKTILDINPKIVVHDLHSGYMSTAYALALEGVETIGVQHHHAHAAACMAENGLDEPVIAITLDGTGLGTDNTIWGGEILSCTLDSFERRAHIVQVPMPGGDSAAREPWRMGVAWLFHCLGPGLVDLDTPLVRGLDPAKLEFLIRMMERGINSPMTSSCGRLFDAVAAILGLAHDVSYESQAAMALEAISTPLAAQGYELDIRTDKAGMVILDFSRAVQAIVHDLAEGASIPTLARRFHTTVVDAFVGSAARIGRQTSISTVVLSGGVFNNRIILGEITDELEALGLTVYSHTKVPSGDGGISLGQAAVAGAIKGIKRSSK